MAFICTMRINFEGRKFIEESTLFSDSLSIEILFSDGRTVAQKKDESSLVGFLFFLEHLV
jgi:hypothetical protein